MSDTAVLMLIPRTTVSCSFSSPNASRDGSCVSFDRANVTEGVEGGGKGSGGARGMHSSI